MEIKVCEWLIVFIQNFIWEISHDVKKDFFTKRKFKRFQKDLDESVREFCCKHEGLYLNSSAFHFFIIRYKFVEDIVSRATATKINKSNKEFLDDCIKAARSIAEHEEIGFGHEEEMLIKDLYKLIDIKVSNFFNEMLSVEQRVIITKMLGGIAELQNDICDLKNDTDRGLSKLNENIKNISKLSEYKECIIANLIFKSLWDNDFYTLNKLEQLIDGKSSSLEKFLKAITFLIIENKSEDSMNQIIIIENKIVRDLAIKALLPVYIFMNQDLTVFESSITSQILCSVVHALSTGDYNCIFQETIDNNQVTEIHLLSLNKKMLCEEEWLVKHVMLLYLYKMQIYNVHEIMKKLIGEDANWFDKLIIADKIIDFNCNKNKVFVDENSIRSIKDDLRKSSETITNYGKNIQVLYWGILLKADSILGEDDVLEEEIPDEIKQCNPIESFLFMKKIERQEIDVCNVYHFAERTGEYWVLNNFFISLNNPKALIVFCKDNEDIFEKDPLIFIAFIKALNKMGDDNERMKYLQKYKNILCNYYEFWNEYLEIDKSDAAKSEFVDLCRSGNIRFILIGSEELLVERLLQLQEYNVALLYVKGMEIKGFKKNKIAKYKAVIEQNKGNYVEALKLYKEAYEGATDDAYIVDSILTISLLNNRKIDEKYIKAAEKIGSSRLLMLVAAVYMNNGDKIGARLANKRAMYLSENALSGVYSQYLSLDLFNKNDSVQKISGIEVDTCAECKGTNGNKLCVCIESDLVLPMSPYEWQGNIHMYRDDAAELGILRKHVGEIIELWGKQYEIEKIIPLDAYFFRTCIDNLEKMGEAQTFISTTNEVETDISALMDWILQNTKDGKLVGEWLKQYNNIDDVPLPLYMYKGFTKYTYLQFVDLIFEDKNIFIREYKSNLEQLFEDKKYILSFGAAIMLYKIAFPIEKIVENNCFITSSMLVQVELDAAKIIEEYDREHVASMGVYDGKVFLNQADESRKEYWIKEAGKIKKYFNQIPVVENSNDLKGELFEKTNIKELIGICDYDALTIAQNDSNYVLITLEAILNFWAKSKDVNFDCCCLVDWIVGINLSCIELLLYIKKLLNYGCLYSINHSVLKLISEKVQVVDDNEKKRVYVLIDEIMKSIDLFEEKSKLLAVQSIVEEVNFAQNKGINIDRHLLWILTTNILILKRQKIEISYDNNGKLVLYLRDMTDDEKKTIIIEPNSGKK